MSAAKLTLPQLRRLRLAAREEAPGVFALTNEPMVRRLEAAGLWTVQPTAHGACWLRATDAGRLALKAAGVAW